MGQEEAASAGRFVSHLAPARKNPNGTGGRSAPYAWLARAIRRANRAGANASACAHAIRAKKGRAAGKPAAARTERKRKEERYAGYGRWSFGEADGKGRDAAKHDISSLVSG